MNDKLSPFLKPLRIENITARNLVELGKVGALIVAGGQGTRLGFNAPKGLYPITDKTLLQIFAERTVTVSKKAKRSLPLAIMTSSVTDQAIREHFSENHFFGLDPKQVSFYIQGELPFLTLDGQQISDKNGQIATGPDGNGQALELFYQKGIWESWRSQGIDYLNFIQVDNPLADPFDDKMPSLAQEENADVVIKCVERRDPNEKVGVLVERNKKIEIIEYSELEEPPTQAYANISNFCFSMEFIQYLYEELKVELPLHKAIKPVYGHTKACKFERFIFDVLPFSRKTTAVLDERSRCFAPLKNRTGEDSPESVRKALLS